LISPGTERKLPKEPPSWKMKAESFPTGREEERGGPELLSFHHYNHSQHELSTYYM
jgi:hypothetical protein